MSSKQESMNSAGYTPNADANQPGGILDDTERDVDRLAKAIQLVVPDVGWSKDANDEGQYYFHLGDPQGLVDYYIEPGQGGYWEGHPNGALRLLKPFRGPSPQVVAVLTVMAFVSRLVEIAKDAGGLILAW